MEDFSVSNNMAQPVQHSRVSKILEMEAIKAHAYILQKHYKSNYLTNLKMKTSVKHKISKKKYQVFPYTCLVKKNLFYYLLHLYVQIIASQIVFILKSLAALESHLTHRSHFHHLTLENTKL